HTNVHVNQLMFPAIQVPSNDLNTLDDYEEGLWTPSDGSGAALAFTITGALYIKIGKLVCAMATMAYPITADASPSALAGLPFKSGGDSGIQGPLLFGYNDSGTSLVGYVNANATTALIYPAGGLVRRTNVQLSGSTMVFAALYRA